MKSYLILIISIISLSSCRSIKQVPITNETTIHERVVTVPVPQDSASIVINFTIDPAAGSIVKNDTIPGWFSLLIPKPSKFRIADYTETKSKNVETSFKVKDNKVSISFKTTRDSARVVVSDTLRKKEVPVIVPKEVKVKQKLNWFQRTFMYSGIGFWVILIIIIIVKLIIKFK